MIDHRRDRPLQFCARLSCLQCSGLSIKATLILQCVLVMALLSGAQSADATSMSGPLIGTPTLTYGGDSADPSILVVNGTYYAYSTNFGEQNMPVMSSTDLIHWRRIGDAMALLPSWAIDLKGFTWAPFVALVPGGGGYEAFFSALDINGQECLGRATAPTPTGPFLDTSPNALLCSKSQGAIDPSLFRSASGDFLIWKVDTGKNEPSRIVAQQLSAMDSSLMGAPTTLLTAEQAWEDGIVEGPSLVAIEGQIWLFFSANRWDTSNYVIGATTCASPLGTCDGTDAHIVESSGPGMAGPGGPDVFVAQNHLDLAFSAWIDGPPGARGARRALYVSRLDAGGS